MNQNYAYQTLPAYIRENLNSRFIIRPYQAEAIHQFINALDNNPETLSNRNPFLFHMATGSGKTLIMAACILHLYQLGYREILFFVNNSNIIKKTVDNFCNPYSSKYLFASQVYTHHQHVEILPGNLLEASSSHTISIHFTTIQQLHYSLQNPAEDSLTFETLRNKKLVLISDEAHHIHASTKRSRGTVYDGNDTWESTVQKITEANEKNLLLDFTATAHLENEWVAKKYANKIVFDFSLKQFTQQGYSKYVEVISAAETEQEIVLQAVICSELRRYLFRSLEVHAKPVILFKSKTIRESQEFALRFKKLFTELKPEAVASCVKNLREKKFPEIEQWLSGQSISLQDFTAALKQNFDVHKCLLVNSKVLPDEYQAALNNLEEADNHYRVVFAVDKLNEGWDVLNLFDIVKLYQTNSSKHVIQQTSVAEAQLIGRGARYFPFAIHLETPLHQRRFTRNDGLLMLTETLLYHCAYEPQYIQQLEQDVAVAGLKVNANILPQKDFVPVQKPPVHFKEIQIRIAEKTQASNFISLSVLSPAVLQKALNEDSFFRFNHLQQLFPQLNSVAEFITSKKYLAAVMLIVPASTNAPDVLSPFVQLHFARKALFHIKNLL